MNTQIISAFVFALLSAASNVSALPQDAATATNAALTAVAKDDQTTTTTSSSPTGLRVGILVVCGAVGLLILWGLWFAFKRYRSNRNKRQQPQQQPIPYQQQYQQPDPYQQYYQQQHQYPPPPVQFKERSYGGYSQW